LRDRIQIQPVAAFAGVAFLVVGVLGFVPGITTHYGEMGFAGHDSGAKLLNLFQVSILLNVVHLLFGVVGLVLARTVDGARNFLTGGGVAYLALWVLGVVGAGAWVPFNTADNWLHFTLGIGMIGLGFVAGRGPVRAATISI
jgi:hypothetical protein